MNYFIVTEDGRERWYSAAQVKAMYSAGSLDARTPIKSERMGYSLSWLELDADTRTDINNAGLPSLEEQKELILPVQKTPQKQSYKSGWSDLPAAQQGLLIGGCLFVFCWILSALNGGRSSSVMAQNSSWDNSVPNVKLYLKETRLDPSSLEIIETSSVRKNSDGSSSVDCTYRAKNVFGGYVVEKKTFQMDSTGKVIGARDQ